MATAISDFERAVEAFKENSALNEAELVDFQLTDLPSLQQAINAIQNQQAKNKRLMYMRRLKPFLDTMEDYGQILKAFLNTSNYIAFVWGPMKFILLTASNLSEALNSLLDAYQQIGEQIPQLSQYQDLFPSSPHMGTALFMIFQDILEFHREALGFFKRRKWERLFQSSWRGFNSKINGLRDKMQQHRRLIESQAGIVEFEEIQKIRKLAEVEFQNARDADLDRRRSKVLQWLSPASSETIQEGCEKARSEYPRTGEWLLTDDKFSKWFHPNFCSNPLLWLSGIPGAGKSVLASLVIEEARALPNTTVTFFYCKYGDESRNSFLAVARGILSQVLSSEKSNDILLYVDEKASTSGETVLSSSKLAKELLETIFQSCKKTYIILDGLDECNRDERKEIATWFRQLVDGLPRREMDTIRCLFVSQDDGYARKDLSMLPSIKLTLNSNKSDIETYAKVWHQRIEERFGPLDPKKLNIANIVTAKAQGMFLFAKLVVLHLYNQTSRKKLMEEMEERFPRNLEEAYARIMDRILEPSTATGRQNDAKQLLGWIACAKRPMKWYEIQGAVAIDLENQAVDYEGRMHRVDPKVLCASLVEIRSDNSIELVHTTAREYLIGSKHINPTKVEYDLAILSVSYLSLPEITKDREDCETEEALLQGFFSFYEYAVSSWVFHLEAGVSVPAKELLAQLAEALEVFLDLHWTDSPEALVVSKTTKDKLQPLQEYDIYSRLVQAVISTRKQFGRHGQGPSDDEVLDLSTITAEVRTVLERLTPTSTGPERQLTLEGFYGPNQFKCPRVNCQYFYKGFPKEEPRKQHVARHERAFLCYFEGCPSSIFGYSFPKELQGHMFNDHGIDTSDDLDFPTTALTLRQKTHPSIHHCDKCSKSFTRKHNLMAHLRVHEGDKPFACNECGLTFTRENDKKRHEALHGGEKTFVCKGTLDGGGEWGCGLSFFRADKLSSHHKSAIGSRCIRPVLEERAEAKRKLGEEERAMHVENPGESDPINSLSTPLPSTPPFLENAAMTRVPSVAATPPDEDRARSRLLEVVTKQTIAPLMPKGGSVDTPKSRGSPSQLMMRSESDAYTKVGISSKHTYQRPKHNRVLCKLCPNDREGFRGEHELRRHVDREHKSIVKRWICVEPNDGLAHAKPLLPLSRCKACHEQKKKYTAYYNAAAHLRRAHFNPKMRRGDNVKRIGKSGGDWPPMSELKFWMKEVEDQNDDQDLRDNSEGLDGNDVPLGGLEGMEAFEGSNFGTSFDPSLNQMPTDATKITAQSDGIPWVFRPWID
ncbi:hypothetical protein F5882DRAFT_354269 [Hyaloscypha sp. PMI_1271]|nr:hypothetical protein F5882DRAFT_354269 [Hyaloscypha sp. PMI_1271]